MTSKNKYCYDFPRPSVTVDCVIFGYDESDLKILLIKRGIDPFKGFTALPGGFIHEHETLDAAARRELYEETNLSNVYIEQLQTFGNPGRDSRGRVISIAYYALIKREGFISVADDNTAKARWYSVGSIPKLAFDHAEIVETALNRLKEKIRRQPVGFELLSEKFTFSDLQHLYESVLQKKLDKRNFRKKIDKTAVVVRLNEKQKGVSHRAAYFYKFDQKKYKEMTKKGFNFEI
jgi:8-oxo-dGTP diphosphatase